MSKSIGVGLIGLGTVGSGVVRLLQDAPCALQRRLHAQLEILRVAVRDTAKPRLVELNQAVFTGDGMEVVNDPAVQMVVELTGAAPAYQWIKAALTAGKDVVTANKAVLATHGAELFGLALENDADLMFEASVAAGIPIIRSLRNGLVANRVESLYGILNGTTNYMLTQMSRGAGGYDQILKQAQEKGFAEPDPTLDVNGMDAAAKLAILCRIAFHSTCTIGDIYCEGIEAVEEQDIRYARELGYTLKLLAIAKLKGEGVEARVHPALVPSQSLMANIHDEFNAIEVVGSAVGNQVFYGRGAGQLPTASAVVADMVDLAERRNAGAGTAIGDMVLGGEATRIASVEASEIRYYLRLQVLDQPGVMAQITRILADEEISISSIIQKEAEGQCGTVPLVIITHLTIEAAMQRALAVFGQLECVRGTVQLIRMEEL
jgi:homoserine dehydrogenase